MCLAFFFMDLVIKDSAAGGSMEKFSHFKDSETIYVEV